MKILDVMRSYGMLIIDPLITAKRPHFDVIFSSFANVTATPPARCAQSGIGIAIDVATIVSLVGIVDRLDEMIIARAIGLRHIAYSKDFGMVGS